MQQRGKDDVSATLLAAVNGDDGTGTIVPNAAGTIVPSNDGTIVRSTSGITPDVIDSLADGTGTVVLDEGAKKSVQAASALGAGSDDPHGPVAPAWTPRQGKAASARRSWSSSGSSRASPARSSRMR